MKISLLKVREDFDNIFCKSLENFLSKKFDWNGEVQANMQGEQVFYVNDQLNVIYPKYIKRALLTDLIKEYSWSPIWWKRQLQRIYSFFAIRFPAEKLFSKGRFSITPAIKNLEKWVFLPGNHSIRVIDFPGNECHVFLKVGFFKGFLENDFNIRRDFPDLPVPKVYNYSSEKHYYSEDKILGLPLNRLPNISERNIALKQARDALQSLYSKTKDYLSSEKYLRELCERLHKNSQLLDNELSGVVLTVCQKLKAAAQSYLPDEILVAQSHGDFQDANILKGKDRIYIIDWEYSCVRSIYYDAFTYELFFRFPQKMLNIYPQAVQKNQNNHENITWANDEESSHITGYRYLALLEDLDLKVQECVSISKITSNESVRTWLKVVYALENL